MNSDVRPLVAAIVILFAFLAIGLWAWSTGEAKEFGGPAGLSIDPDGHLFIQIQNQIVEHDSDGAFIKRHDLSQLGIEVVIGSIAFFSNGDVLLRRGPDPRSFMSNVRAYQRKTNEKSLDPETADAGMFRCELDSMSCTRFGSQGIDFKGTHSIYIDWPTDEVYFSDTTRHVLRKYSASGEALAAPVGGFRFPNQLMIHDGHLLVVDTNHHEIRAVRSETGLFGTDIGAFDVVPNDAKYDGQEWPSHVARVGDQWWVNNMRNDMNEGRIYIFDSSWIYQRKLDLPQGADPIALLAFNGDVLISDWNGDSVRRVVLADGSVQDFLSSGLRQIIAESRAARREFMLYAYAGILLFVFLLLGLIVRAMASNRTGRA